MPTHDLTFHTCISPCSKPWAYPCAHPYPDPCSNPHPDLKLTSSVLAKALTYVVVLPLPPPPPPSPVLT